MNENTAYCHINSIDCVDTTVNVAYGHILTNNNQDVQEKNTDDDQSSLYSKID